MVIQTDQEISPIETQSTSLVVEKENAKTQQKSSNFKQKRPTLKLKGLGLRAKATILAVFLGSAPVLIVGGIAYSIADRVISNKIAQEKIAESSQFSDQVNRFFSERIANTKTLVKIVDIVAPNFPELDGEKKQALTDALTQFYLDYLVFENIAIYDSKGNVLVQSRQSAQEINQSKFSYFKEVIGGNNIVISEVVDVRGGLAIYIAAPLKNKQGQSKGVLAGKIPLSYIGNALLKSASLVKGTSYKIVDSKGIILQNFQDPNNLAVGSNIGEKFTLFDKYNLTKKPVAWRESNQPQEPLNTYVPVRQILNIDWNIVTSTDASIAFAAQKTLFRTIVTGTLITAFVTGVLGAILALVGTRPINELTKIVSELAQGKLDTRAPVKGQDEIAILGENINIMAQEIQNLLDISIKDSLELQKQNEVLAELARNEALLQGDAKQAILTFTEAIADTLKVARVGVWLYNHDRSRFVSYDLYSVEDVQHSEGTVLTSEHIENYEQALLQNQIIAADDVNTHSLTQELAEQYLTPNGIVSLLSIPIVANGHTIGVLSCEHKGEPREWKPQEETFCSSIANLVSLALESEATQKEVEHILDIVSELEEGNLTVKAQVSDRSTGLVADTLNRLIEELALVLLKVSESAQNVTRGVLINQEIAQNVAQNAGKQAKSVTQVLDLSQGVETAAENSAQEVETTKQSLANLAETVKQGQTAIGNLQLGIEILQSGSERIIQQMKTLGEFVGLADQFVQDQNEIAQQTQVLALNASLVASRAAQQQNPRRFAQVAQEFQGIAQQVSALAQQTNLDLETLEKRTSQIHSVVSTIDNEVQELGGLVDDFNKGVQESNQLFQNVTVVSEQAIKRGEAIAVKNEDIIKATEQTIKAIRDIAQIAQNTAKITEQTLKQTEEMGESSSQLIQTIDFFKLPS
jgi:twitching motility protein PilJ